jgi:hypothetical protein
MVRQAHHHQRNQLLTVRPELVEELNQSPFTQLVIPNSKEYDILTSLLSCIITMLAKITSKNQLTLPKSVVNLVGKTDYFEVEVENGRIVLTPVRIQQADAVRAKLEALGIDAQDVVDAIDWARNNPI